MSDAAYETIQFEIDAAVATIAFNRPEKLNAINQRLATDLVDALGRLDGVRALVLTGNERAFSSGADLSERGQNPELTTTLDAYDGVAAVEIPVIAAIEGYCLGGGLELALCCDLRIASETARLGTPEVLRGIMPGGGGTQRLPRLIGPARAKDLMFTGKHIDAVTAERWGLVNQVVPPGEALAAALQLAGQLAAGAPLALREIKRLVDDGAALDLSDALQLERERSAWLRATADAREGIQAFLDRRPPDFKGE